MGFTIAEIGPHEDGKEQLDDVTGGFEQAEQSQRQTEKHAAIGLDADVFTAASKSRSCDSKKTSCVDKEKGSNPTLIAAFADATRQNREGGKQWIGREQAEAAVAALDGVSLCGVPLKV